MDALQFTWFILFFTLFIGYALLDGYDLGMGVISLFTRKQEDRNALIDAIRPWHDGNEAWLLIAGIGLFAAFPTIYTTLCSAFQIPFILWLLAFITRIVSIELGRTTHNPKWQRSFDLAFGFSSLMTILLLGITLANVLRGLPINHEGAYVGTFASLLNPYSLLGGVLGLVTLTMHGAAFGAMKTQGNLQDTMRQWVSNMWGVMIVLWICLTAYTVFEAGYLFRGIFKNVVFDGLMVLFFISILIITISSSAQKDLHSFLASSMAIACMLGMAGSCLLPYTIPSNMNLQNSLTLAKNSASPQTLKIMITAVLAALFWMLIYRVIICKRLTMSVNPDQISG